MPASSQAPPRPASPALRRLLDRLALERVDDDVLVDHGAEEPTVRLFGGQVAAQALAALGATVAPGRPVHSLHLYFVAMGLPGEPVRFQVARVKEGRTFEVRRVDVEQRGRTILTALASFHAPEPGPVHGRPRSAPVPDPDSLPRWEEALAGRQDRLTLLWRQPRPVDLRYVDGPPQLDPLLAERPVERLRTLWRADGTLPDDPLVHACVAVYACDTTLLETALLPHRTVFADGRFHAASLDHAMWFHAPFRADEWLLHEQDAQATAGARGLAVSRMYDVGGRLVVSAAQEGLLRPAGDEPAVVGTPPR